MDIDDYSPEYCPWCGDYIEEGEPYYRCDFNFRTETRHGHIRLHFNSEECFHEWYKEERAYFTLKDEWGWREFL